VRQKKYVQAEEAFKKALETNPDNDKANGGWRNYMKKQGSLNSRKKYRQKADTERAKNYNNIVSINYLKLKGIFKPKRDKVSLRTVS